MVLFYYNRIHYGGEAQGIPLPVESSQVSSSMYTTFPNGGTMQSRLRLLRSYAVLSGFL